MNDRTFHNWSASHDTAEAQPLGADGIRVQEHTSALARAAFLGAYTAASGGTLIGVLEHTDLRDRSEFLVDFHRALMR